MKSEFKVALGAGLFGLLNSVAPVAFAQDNSDELDALKAQLKVLAEKVKELEATAGDGHNDVIKIDAETTDGVPVATQGAKPGTFLVPGTDTSIQIGGYIKADIIHDFEAATKNSIAEHVNTYAAIPLEGSPTADQSNTALTARESRLFVQTWTPTPYGDLRTKFEGDFYGADGGEKIATPHSFRIRDAYGELNGWLFGQTFTTFMDLKAGPEVLVFSGVSGRTYLAQAQLRKTFDIGDGLKFVAAIENPYHENLSSVSTLQLEDKAPDVIGLVEKSGDFGHVQVKGVGRFLTANNLATGESEDIFGWGVAASGRVNLWGRDQLRFDMKYGDGMGRYMFQSAITNQTTTYDVTEGLDTVKAYGGYVDFRHFWSDKLRSNFIYGIAKYDNDGNFVPPNPDTYNKSVQSIHVNLLYDLTDKVMLGAEYSNTQREVEDGREGERNRLQFSAKYSF